MSQPEATISVSLTRADGVTVARTVRVSQSIYDHAPVTAFKQRVRRRAIEAVNSVIGSPKDLKITEE